MKHDKYKEGRLAQINDRRTIILSWFAVFHQLAKSGTLDLVRHPPHSEANVGDIHANARFFGYPEFLPNITATSSPLLPLPGHREKGRRKGLAGRFTTLAAALGINLWVVLKQEKLRGQVVITDSARQRLSESNKSDIIATSFAFI